MTPIELLRRLDEMDAELETLNGRLEEGPSRLQESRQNIARLRARITESKGLEDQLAKDAHSLELDIQKHEAEMEKQVSYQRQAKSNEEYQLFKERAERGREAVSKLEEEALLKMEEQDRRRAERGSLLEQLKEAEESHQRLETEVAATGRELTARIAELEARRRDAASGAEREDLEVYERVRRSWKDRALAPIVGSVCGACFVSLPPQLINLALLGKSITQCVSCSRILYVEDAGEVLRALRVR